MGGWEGEEGGREGAGMTHCKLHNCNHFPGQESLTYINQPSLSNSMPVNSYSNWGGTFRIHQLTLHIPTITPSLIHHLLWVTCGVMNATPPPAPILPPFSGQSLPISVASLLLQCWNKGCSRTTPPVIVYQLTHLCMGKAMCRTALHGRMSLRIPSASLLFSSSVRRRGSLATKLSLTT